MSERVVVLRLCRFGDVHSLAFHVRSQSFRQGDASGKRFAIDSDVAFQRAKRFVEAACGVSRSVCQRLIDARLKPESAVAGVSLCSVVLVRFETGQYLGESQRGVFRDGAFRELPRRLRIGDDAQAVEAGWRGTLLFVNEAEPQFVRRHVGKELKRVPDAVVEQKDFAQSVGDVGPVSEQFHLSAVEAKHDRAAWEGTRIGLVIIGMHLLEIVVEPFVVADGFQSLGQGFHAGDDFVERAGFVLVVLRDADVPDVVVSEMKLYGVGPGGDHHAHAAVAEHGAFKEIDGGLV